MDPLPPIGPGYNDLEFSYGSVEGISLHCPGILGISEVKSFGMYHLSSLTFKHISLGNH
jgi:hypothetical protein